MEEVRDRRMENGKTWGEVERGKVFGSAHIGWHSRHCFENLCFSLDLYRLQTGRRRSSSLYSIVVGFVFLVVDVLRSL